MKSRLLTSLVKGFLRSSISKRPSCCFSSVTDSSLWAADLPQRVTIVEVAPRDGLQNEANFVDTPTKVQFVEKLADTGIKVVEVTGFVSPKWIPQMSDHSAVMKSLRPHSAVRYPVLVPNMRGFEQALEAGAKEVSITAAASEAFLRKNINCGFDEAHKRFQQICNAAKKSNVSVRGYISCSVGCPYEGHISPDAVLRSATDLLEMGCYEVSLSDTIGVGTPGSFSAVCERLLQTGTGIRPAHLAVHCHDTYGQALTNIFTCLQYGIATVDASVAGLGGCPYARGASGNVATEDVVYMLKGLEIETDIDLQALCNVGMWICERLQRPNGSKTAMALAGTLSHVKTV